MSEPITNRRAFLGTLGVVGAASMSMAASQAARDSAANTGGTKPRRLRVGQIGTGHAHAGGKMDAL
jgi:hypothetical protein